MKTFNKIKTKAGEMLLDVGMKLLITVIIGGIVLGGFISLIQGPISENLQSSFSDFQNTSDDNSNAEYGESISKNADIEEIRYSTNSKTAYESWMKNILVRETAPNRFSYTNNDTYLKDIGADKWGLSSIATGTWKYNSAGAYTFIHPNDISSVTSYYNYATQVTCEPKAATMYAVRNINAGSAYADGAAEDVQLAVIYAISFPEITDITQTSDDGTETYTGKQYITTLYMADFSVVEKSEKIVIMRSFYTRTITDKVWDKASLETSAVENTCDIQTVQANGDGSIEIEANLTNGTDPNEDGVSVSDVSKMLKINLSFEDDSPSTPIFNISGKYVVDDTEKSFTVRATHTTSEASTAKKAAGIYYGTENEFTASEVLPSFANPTVTYDTSVYAEDSINQQSVTNSKLLALSDDMDDLKAKYESMSENISDTASNTNEAKEAVESFEDEFYYKPGDTYTSTVYFTVGGLLTSAGTTVNFDVYLPKKLDKVSKVTLTDATTYIRTTESGYLDGLDFNTDGVLLSDTYVYNCTKQDGNRVQITIKKSTAFSNAENNTPLGISLTRFSFKFS